MEHRFQTVKIWDDMLTDYVSREKETRLQDYRGTRNPVDDVWYPGISDYLNIGVVDDLCHILCAYFENTIQINTMFNRLSSTKQATAPHQAHNDASMGDYTFLFYWQDGPGGTDLVSHRATGDWTGENPDVCMQDTNNYDAWIIEQSIAMKANRGVVFPSNWMHRAEPVGGFGSGPKDGRIVTTIFLSIGDD